MTPLRRERLVVGETELAYRLDGPEGAPVLVLASSLGTALEMWDAQVPALSSSFRLLRYDLRGHGQSSSPPGPYTIAGLADDVVALLDAIGCERASVAGVSIGGMIGIWLGANRPERVDRLALCCTAPYLGPPDACLERAQAVRSAGTSSLAGPLFGRWFTPGFLDSRPDVADLFAAMLEACSDDGYAACCEAIAQMDERGSLARIAAPTLVLAGAADPVAPPSVALELQQAIPGAGLTVLPGAAHLANVERAETFTEALLSHLTGPPIERGMAERRRVLGEGYVAEASARAAAAPVRAYEAFQRLITAGAWGAVWDRPTLSRSTRRLLTVSLLAALGRLEEFDLHARAALADESGDGLDAEDIGEALIHLSVYAGVPAANAAFSRLLGIVGEQEGLPRTDAAL